MTQISLAKRLTLSLIATIIAVSLATAGFIHHFARQQLERELDSKARTTLAYLTGSLAVPIWDLSDAIVGQICTTVAQDDNIVQLEVIDQGRDKVLFSLRRAAHESGQVQVFNPIAYRGHTVGEVRLALTTRPLEKRLDGLLWSLLGTVAIIIVTVALVMMALIRTHLRRPFAELSRVVNAYGEGNYLTNVAVPYLEFQPFKNVLEEMGRKIQEQLHMLREINQSLEKSRETALAASRAKSTFLANMSHELRTPLNAITGMVALALRHAVDPKIKHQLETIDRSSQHLLHVINDILDISKIEADRLGFERVGFKIGTVLENLASQIGHKATDKGLKLLIDCPPGLPGLSLVGDPTRLGQILLNLAGNALKFTEQGTIALRVSLVEDNAADVLLQFEVRDTGIGIASEDQARLFSAFEQADGSTTRRYGGTGLGLAISKRLCQLMGGTIGVESVPGHGSNFWFTARLAKGESAAAESVAPRSAEARLQSHHAGARILLAEDEPINREVLLGLLTDIGLQVDLAEDGAEAVELAAQHSYALILMDMQMPILNGLDATRAIRSEPTNATTPIIATTANAFMEDRQACLAAGMNDYIAKPIEPQRLFQTILHWLENQP